MAETNSCGGKGSEDLDRLITLIYPEFRELATRHLQKERRNHTLTPTALVNEAYVRLKQYEGIQWENRKTFLRFSAKILRQVLVDYARMRNAEKRAGDFEPISVDAISEDVDCWDVLALNEALEKLERIRPEHVELAELRIFGGLNVMEASEVLDLPQHKLYGFWTVTEAWLHRELTRGDDQEQCAT